MISETDDIVILKDTIIIFYINKITINILILKQIFVILKRQYYISLNK